MKNLPALRRWVLIVLVLGLLGTTTDLLLIEHYEDALQLILLGLAAFALIVVGWKFKEYRPWKTREQFDKEIGKYVDAKETARLWRYFVIQ